MKLELTPSTKGCARCGSAHLRSSRARRGKERLLRELTRTRFYRCRDCGHRGSYRASARSPFGGRASDEHTIRSTWRTRLIIAGFIAAALVLGIWSGLNAHG
ncbi:hypothetical protein [Anaeromyxobacter paludicola]|uniref:hypothetical protein n=1 Tax=Anaeromyxobacter paludicola TaxID=2918171 RepID=UPI0020C099A9|nr:hypothetical protein [Anaeromyxobacter paludicola]